MSILSNNKPQAHLGRTSHDLSSTHAFSMRPAVLRPVIVQDCVPDSAFRINATDLVRTTSLQTAAFLRGKHELDFFFVPYNQIYSHFNDIVLERGDEKSPLLGVTPSQIPTFSLEHLYFLASVPYLFFRLVTFYNSHISLFKNPATSVTTLTYCIRRGFSPFYDTSDIDLNEFLLTQCCYNSIDEFSNNISDYSFIGYDTLALLDTLGFGNFGSSVVSLCDTYEQFALSQYSPTDINSNDPVLISNAFIGELQNAISSFFNNSDFKYTDATTGTKYVSLLRLFAYQKIFYDRYRDEVFDTNPLYRYAFSMDGEFSSIHISPFVTSSVSEDQLPLLTFLRSHTRMVKKDIVSGLFPSAQYGSSASMGSTGSMDELNLPHSLSDPIQAPNIRYALAMQKYRETLLRAGSRSNDVLKAMFGVESNYINDTYVRYLGSFSGQLELNKVSATAETGSYSVGDLAGNVFSSLQGNTIQFTCNDYGCVIGVMSFFPELLHNNFGLSPHVLKNLPLHFFKSQFEDLGLQPVSSSIVSVSHYDPNHGITAEDKTLGFSARYNEYKTNLDFAHDQFGRHFLRHGNVGVVINTQDGFNSNYVVTRSLLEDLSDTSIRNYLLPDCMDSIFAALDTGDITNYHFDIILDVQINAVLPMSNLGLPY